MSGFPPVSRIDYPIGLSVLYLGDRIIFNFADSHEKLEQCPKLRRSWNFSKWLKYFGKHSTLPIDVFIEMASSEYHHHNWWSRIKNHWYRWKTIPIQKIRLDWIDTRRTKKQSKSDFNIKEWGNARLFAIDPRHDYKEADFIARDMLQLKSNFLKRRFTILTFHEILQGQWNHVPYFKWLSNHFQELPRALKHKMITFISIHESEFFPLESFERFGILHDNANIFGSAYSALMDVSLWCHILKSKSPIMVTYTGFEHANMLIKFLAWMKLVHDHDVIQHDKNHQCVYLSPKQRNKIEKYLQSLLR